jgi:hypothetical protein
VRYASYLLICPLARYVAERDVLYATASGRRLSDGHGHLHDGYDVREARRKLMSLHQLPADRSPLHLGSSDVVLPFSRDDRRLSGGPSEFWDHVRRRGRGVRLFFL